MKDLGTLGGTASSAFDINDPGQIVGFDSDFGPFLYSNGDMLRLSDLVTNIGDWSLPDMRAINNAGQIAGVASSLTVGIHAVLLTPEPSDGSVRIASSQCSGRSRNCSPAVKALRPLTAACAPP